MYFISAGLSGGIPFVCLSTGFGNIWLCEHIGCHFGDQFWWFVGTDVAVYFIYKYYMASHASTTQVQNNTTYIELERPLTVAPVSTERQVYKFVYVR